MWSLPSLLFTALVAAAAIGSPAWPNDDPPGHPAPPPEAYAACTSKAQGDACTVQRGAREIQGTCATDHDDSRLFCRPSEMPPGPPITSTYDAAAPDGTGPGGAAGGGPPGD